MTVVKIKDKRIGVTYVYDQEKSVWDPVKKQARSKRTLIGKLDEETGGIIPTSGRGKKKTSVPEDGSPDYKAMYEEQLSRCSALQKENEALKAEITLLKAAR